jgi:hypothetical protein
MGEPSAVEIELEDDDLGMCPYYWRFECLPGYDPEGTCFMGCSDEPSCVTCEPSGGWPSVHAALTAAGSEGETP